MIIDRQKPATLLSVLLAAALGVSTGCGGPVSPERDKVRTTPISPARLVPEVCSTPAEFLRPPRLGSESVVTYPGGIVVNQAGSAIDLAIRVPSLTTINNETSLGLNFTLDTQNITYFFSGSFKRPDARERIAEFIEQDRMYLLMRYCQEQGISSGRIRYSPISVVDELVEVIRRNPRKYSAEDPFWRSVLAVQFTMAYVARTKVNVSDYDQIPIETPTLLAAERETVARLGLPFSITRFNPDHFLPFP